MNLDTFITELGKVPGTWETPFASNIRQWHNRKRFCPITRLTLAKTGQFVTVDNADTTGAELLGLRAKTADKIITAADCANAHLEPALIKLRKRILQACKLEA
jgi:hypothetical protein